MASSGVPFDVFISTKELHIQRVEEQKELVCSLLKNLEDLKLTLRTKDQNLEELKTKNIELDAELQEHKLNFDRLSKNFQDMLLEIEKEFEQPMSRLGGLQRMGYEQEIKRNSQKQHVRLSKRKITENFKRIKDIESKIAAARSLLMHAVRTVK